MQIYRYLVFFAICGWRGGDSESVRIQRFGSAERLIHTAFRPFCKPPVSIIYDILIMETLISTSESDPEVLTQREGEAKRGPPPNTKILLKKKKKKKKITTIFASMKIKMPDAPHRA